MSGTARHLVILGGGLAGMAAAAALTRADYRITLLEKRAVLGGRAGSHLDTASGEWVDNCQHVLMPCCTNLLDFYERLGVRDKIRFYQEIPFIDRKGRTSRLRSSFLPAPLHCAPSFLALRFLSLGSKLRIARGLAALIRLGRGPFEDQRASDWLQNHGQSRETLRDFWEPILVSALNEYPDRASLRHTAKVYLNAFLSHPRGWWLGVPTVPLGALYGEPFARLLRESGGEIRPQTEVESLVVREGKITGVHLRDGGFLEADLFVLALPWHAALPLLTEIGLHRSSATESQAFEPSPITGVHLFFDRVVTELPFAALPGSEVQWFFNKTSNYERSTGAGSYLQLVTSASRSWMDLNKAQILKKCLDELSVLLPETRLAKIVKSFVLKEPAATFSPTPAVEQLRPPPETTISNLFLAGDWIQTGWPATMEGAVRGGYLAAEAVLRSDGRPSRLLVPDLPPQGFMRLLRGSGMTLGH